MLRPKGFEANFRNTVGHISFCVYMINAYKLKPEMHGYKL